MCKKAYLNLYPLKVETSLKVQRIYLFLTQHLTVRFTIGKQGQLKSVCFCALMNERDVDEDEDAIHRKNYKFNIQICHVNHSISFRDPPKKKFTMAQNKTESIDFAQGKSQ